VKSLLFAAIAAPLCILGRLLLFRTPLTPPPPPSLARILIQTVHYFYAYLTTVPTCDAPATVVVPSGAAGNLCAGVVAKLCGLPLAKIVAATNENGGWVHGTHPNWAFSGPAPFTPHTHPSFKTPHTTPLPIPILYCKWYTTRDPFSHVPRCSRHPSPLDSDRVS
jgi:hypothetical protein